MEKFEKKYKEAIKRAKAMIKVAEKEEVYKSAITIFPELAESEDDRIRKAIYNALRYLETELSWDFVDDVDILDVYAWLEKQGENKFGQREECLDCQFNYSGECKGSCAMKKGEQKEYTFKSIPRLLDMIEPSDRAKAYCQKLIDTLTKEGYNIDAKIVEGVLKGWNGEDVPMAVMDEQKPQGKSALEAIKEEKVDNANKVEPKFKVGDFIKHNKANIICKVILVNSNSYYVENIETSNRIELFNAEQNFHVWTIQDAKDGDVLYSPTHRLIWVYKDKDKYYAATNLNYIEAISFDGDIVIPSDICPANRVQRSILLQKMEESGYMWDEERKELKKIEFEE